MDNNLFGIKLNSLRQEQHLTIQELAGLAGVSAPLISNLIHGHRVIGEQTARKIASALQLKGRAFDDFVHLAMNGCAEKVLNSSKAYPVEVLNLVAGQLSALGILPDKIKRCVRKSPDADASLYLEDGRAAYINVEVAIR